MQHGGVGGLPGVHGLLPGVGHGQLDRAPVLVGGGAADHAARGERVDDGGDGVGPHMQQPGQLAGPGAGMLGQRGQQFQLGHGQRVAGVGDPGAAAQRPAQPGDALGQPVGPVRPAARAAPPWLGLVAGTSVAFRHRARPPRGMSLRAVPTRRPAQADARAQTASAAMASAPGPAAAEVRAGVQRQCHYRYAQGGAQPAGHVHHPAGGGRVPAGIAAMIAALFAGM